MPLRGPAPDRVLATHLPFRFGAPAVGLALVLLAGCGGQPAITACEDRPNVHAICGLQNPEDLALLSDGNTVIVSQFGTMDGSRPGSLALLDLRSESHRIAFPEPTPTTGGDRWGDPSCPGPPPAAFSPHGIDLDRRDDGRLQLLVVNHGGRESVEFFEVTGTGPATRLQWRGCAVGSEGSYFNDVVSLPGGGFLVTHMMDKRSEILGLIRSALGSDTGLVYAWTPGGGFAPVPGTEGPFPNGIELSEDGRDLYLNLYMAGEVRRIDRATGELLASAEVAQPDNLSWSRDGRLLVASHTGGVSESMGCFDLEAGACPMAFDIVALDAQTMRGGPIFSQSGPPMGAGTVALDLGGELLIGSFAGDRVIRVRGEAIHAP